ncbi:GntR family transcriptional regulator [Cupriavidus sp. YR651]|uniref:GntR family transcriptional regulator n=1 Tax=Cupriavidus sp. YR651 TaxID=1855315 RepID=UPI00088916DE|nr:GntR family transcriptional regulator [Cupriavidus sp. YR651]SDC89617.1 GntR family transcriptional regulator [Cupriavidus sp. YR651]
MRDNDLLQAPSTPAGLSRYGQIAAQLQQKIVSGTWSPGKAIPAESALASEFGIALGTIRQAIAVLVQDGLLERVQGKGTFVRTGLAGASMMRFFRFRSDSDATAAHTDPTQAGATVIPRSEILSCRSVRLDKGLAARFGLAAGARGLAISRRRWLDERPRLLESIWLPLPRCEALQALPVAEWGELLYPLLARQCGITVHRAVDEVTFRLLATDEAERLDLPDGHPCALVTRQAFDLQGNCVEYRLTRGDAFAFRYTADLR